MLSMSLGLMLLMPFTNMLSNPPVASCSELSVGESLTDMSLSEVADRSGFGDYSGFLRSFRRMTGMAPNAYRKQRSGGH